MSVKSVIYIVLYSINQIHARAHDAMVESVYGNDAFFRWNLNGEKGSVQSENRKYNR